MPSAPIIVPRTPARRPFGRRVWSAGRLLLLAGGLCLTYGIFFMAAMRVATRARDVRVPDVRGKSVGDASTTITNAGLAVRVEPVRRPDAKVPIDHVISQDPEPGTTVRRPRAIHVRISEGPRVAVMPAVTGMSERAAEILLTQDHIDVASKAEVRTNDYEAGVVVAQDPPAKTRAAGVALLINRAQGGVAYVMPDLIGAPGLRAADVLRKQGFTVAIVGESPYPGLPAGIVIRQTPQAGFQVTFGEPISLEISK
jgi:eukaryotic-like serine/threonine-protein kinase